MKIYTFIILCIALLSMVEFTGTYPAGDFVSPVNRNLKLSGTFGELRTNHFHAGLDIKSANKTIGDPIYAAGNGYISRIKIDEFGYGNAIYIDHPDGYTTLYGHLDHFTPEIQAYVTEQQYLQKSFEVDLNPGPEKFPVTQMQQIAFMGNTGNSYGAHLHFEIRRTVDQTPVNPLHFGFDIADHLSPIIQQLILYELNDDGEIENERIMQPKQSGANNYLLEKPIELAADKVAFGLRTYDTEDGQTNQNGIYSIQCKVDGENGFGFSLDEIPFEDARYLNAHIDYQQKVNQNRYFHRCFQLEGNKLPIYFTGSEQGRYLINPEFARQFTISVSDFNGNASTLNFQVVQQTNSAPSAPKQEKFNTKGDPNAVTIVTKQGIQVVWPEGCFYEKTPLTVEQISPIGPGNYSPYYEFEPVDAPVHTFFDVYLDGLAVPIPLINKAFIARCDPGGSIMNCGGMWIGNNLTTGVREMGTYTILVDTIPPKISVLHFNENMNGWAQMDFRISDNVRIRDKARGLLYSAYVDDQWILMSLDGKAGILTHKFNGHILPGAHKLIIKVTDDRGNEGLLEKTFTL